MPEPELPVAIVVGGGIAGLVAARELVFAGRSVVVLEERDRLGGQVAKHSVAGMDLDAGAEAFARRGEELPRLLRALHLDDQVVSPSGAPAWVYRARGAAPLPAASLLGIPGVPLARDVIDVIGTGAALRAQLDNLLPSLVASKAETVGELVRRRMGARVVDELVAPVTRGVHSLSPDELPVDRAAPGLRSALLRNGSLAAAVRAMREQAPAGALVATLRGGMFRLVEALEAELDRFGVEVRTGVRVTGWDSSGVETDVGERIEGEVVLAAPLGIDAPRTRVQVATLAVDAPELATAPRGTGVLVAAGVRDVAARALTHVTAKWPHLAEQTSLQIVRLSYDEGVDVTAERARSDAEALLGVRLPAPVDSAIVVWERTGRRSDPSHAIDGMRRVGEAESGTGLASVVTYARTVAGAIPSDGPSTEG
ncbi:NAD(P)/FAD-dependent oxidoreductase [Homoserinibacter sp. GY 40078]|uniref:protoporphyrinogen/coproporphyrinogen oxidase n=1 Tax=Homoserinibacter sp. GY 40078 TaxID=2603275 RepID=UPI0011C8FDAF|nr:FAD-dependent oxidoreductase [Homoserinibacter sp. GY 40078]TXK18826.1 FAD-dependent oxidoreductase [Homoserinibacter sp. GY 40078]